MRTIKFRAWDKKGKKMIIPTSENCEHYLLLGMLLIGETMEYGTHEEFNYYELMQYTGLKDSKGVEIYEGDIIEGIFPNNRAKSKQVVEYKTNGSHQNKYNVGSQTIGFNLWHTDYEVIGNIYENPELIK